MSDAAEKQSWVARYVGRYQWLAPGAPTGRLSEIAETYWFYLRHCEPERVALRRLVSGKALLPGYTRSWVVACAEALGELEPHLARASRLTLAQQLWDADPLHVVDPHLMARALS